MISLSWRCPVCIVGELTILHSASRNLDYVVCDEEYCVWQYEEFAMGQFVNCVSQDIAFLSQEHLTVHELNHSNEISDLLTSLQNGTKSSELSFSRNSGSFYLLDASLIKVTSLAAPLIGVFTSHHSAPNRVFPLTHENWGLLFSKAILEFPV